MFSPRGLHPLLFFWAGISGSISFNPASQHGTCSPLAPQLLVKGGKEGKQSSIPTHLGKRCWFAVPCSQLDLLYIARSHLPGSPLTQILLTGLPCKGEGAILPLLRNARNPLRPQPRTPRTGWVLGGMGWKSSVTSSMRRKQTHSASVRDASSSALPSTKEPQQREKNSSGSGWAWTQQVWGFQGGVRWLKESYHFFGQSLWATLRASLNVQFPESQGWADTG